MRAVSRPDARTWGFAPIYSQRPCGMCGCCACSGSAPARCACARTPSWRLGGNRRQRGAASRGAGRPPDHVGAPPRFGSRPGAAYILTGCLAAPSRAASAPLGPPTGPAAPESYVLSCAPPARRTAPRPHTRDRPAPAARSPARPPPGVRPGAWRPTCACCAPGAPCASGPCARSRSSPTPRLRAAQRWPRRRPGSCPQRPRGCAGGCHGPPHQAPAVPQHVKPQHC